MAEPTTTALVAAELVTTPAMRDSRALEPRNFTEAFQIARLLQASGMFPESCRTPEGAFVILTKGRELGLPMMQSVTEICVVKGKVQLSAALMQGLVLRSGYAEYFSCLETSDSRAVYETKRVGDPSGPKRFSYSIEQARAAGLVRKGERGLSAWEAHPADMLRARAASKLARMVYPDILSGCYTPDEMQDFDRPREAEPRRAPDPVQEQVQAQVVEAAAPAPAALPAAAPPPATQWVLGVELLDTEVPLVATWHQRIQGATSLEALQQLRQELGQLKRTKRQGEALRRSLADALERQTTKLRQEVREEDLDQETVEEPLTLETLRTHLVVCRTEEEVKKTYEAFLQRAEQTPHSPERTHLIMNAQEAAARAADALAGRYHRPLGGGSQD